jgi:hypothetical protein
MNELGRIFSNDADTQKFFVGARKDQLQQPGGIACYMATSVVRIMGAANDVIDFLFFAGCFRFSGGGNLWNGVDAHREK